jgi:hypothetical protein
MSNVVERDVNGHSNLFALTDVVHCAMQVSIHYRYIEFIAIRVADESLLSHRRSAAECAYCTASAPSCLPYSH